MALLGRESSCRLLKDDGIIQLDREGLEGFFESWRDHILDVGVNGDLLQGSRSGTTSGRCEWLADVETFVRDLIVESVGLFQRVPLLVRANRIRRRS